MDCIAVIPARGGSRRIPNKNWKAFHGKPVIVYSIEAAIKSGLFDKVYVSTDSAELAGIAVENGAYVIQRPAHLAEDSIGTQDVMRHAVEVIDADLACCIYATAPMLCVNDLIRGYKEVAYGATYAFSVGTEPLHDAGMFYFGETYAFRHGIPLVTERSVMIPIDRNRVCDINTEEDWKRAEQMYAELMENA